MPPAAPAPSRLPWYNVATAAAILIGFGWMAYLMVGAATSIGKDDQFRWDRLLLIFNAVQTLTVAAAGVLLGTTVQQARVASAEARADTAQEDAKATAAEAAKAEAARRLVEQLDPPGGADPGFAQLRAVLR